MAGGILLGLLENIHFPQLKTANIFKPDDRGKVYRKISSELQTNKYARV